jgi:hypothetical protein
MKFNVIALRRADDDVRTIARWLAERSLTDADSWLDSYEQLLTQLSDHARLRWTQPLAASKLAVSI